MSLTLRKDRRLGLFENRVLRRIFGPKRDEVIAVLRKIFGPKWDEVIEELRELHCE